MNRGNPSAFIVISMLMLCGLYAVTSVILTDGNTIGQLCQFLMAGGFLFSLMAPRLGFFIWIVFCGYNDLLKRFLVVGGRITHADLKFVLGITPAMFGGVVAALVFSGLMGSRRIVGREWVLLLVGIFLMLLAAVVAATKDHGGFDGVLQSIANNGLYSLLLFVVPLLLKDKSSLVSLWKCLVLTWLPVSAYGVLQQINGFADFEIEYLRSGLSIEIKQLLTNEVRAFSTLNSPTALSIIAAVLAVSSLLLGFMYRGQNGRPGIGRVLAVFCFLTHTAAIIASTGRSALLILPIALLGTWCFVSPQRTKVFYAVVAVSFMLLVASSGWLINHLEELNERSLSFGAPGAFISRVLMVGTYWDRLSGFSNVLMNPSAWSLFGFGNAEDVTAMYYCHDPISETLIQYGAVTLFIVVGSVIYILSWFHRQAWKLETGPDRQFASAMIALAFAILLVSAVSGSVMTVFPVNVFFWLTCSAVLGLTKSPVPEQRPATPQGLPPPPPFHRQTVS